MNFTTRKILIISFGAFLVCLIASAAAPVVFAETPNVEEEPYWGNLKAGDEMRWKYYEPKNLYYELKILEIQGKSLKVYHHRYKVGPHGEIDTIERGKATLRSGGFILSASVIKEYNVPASIYMYKGLIYLATYESAFDACSMYTHKCYDYECWHDYGTGIRFEYRLSEVVHSSPYYQKILIYHYVLEHTTAKLIINGMLPGFPWLLLIAFLNGFLNGHDTQVIALVILALVLVVTVVSYSLARYQEKKKKNT